ncbi:hypothetical protein LUTEI9C_70481 [Luteimonas sp. 9C]|nr:hypothetical protein LUTEI9C_70481 [Luteimonas sp. 9C]
MSGRPAEAGLLLLWVIRFSTLCFALAGAAYCRSPSRTKPHVRRSSESWAFNGCMSDHPF